MNLLKISIILKKIINKEISFEELQKEIIYFLELVDKEYYVGPNKFVSKKEVLIDLK